MSHQQQKESISKEDINKLFAGFKNIKVQLELSAAENNNLKTQLVQAQANLTTLQQDFQSMAKEIREKQEALVAVQTQLDTCLTKIGEQATAIAIQCLQEQQHTYEQRLVNLGFANLT